MESATLWRRVAELVEAGIPFTHCVVVKSTGSVPRKAGAHMLVFPDGAVEGSVGGAGLEEKVKVAAIEALAAGKKPRTESFELWYRNPGGLDSLCGGSLEVYIEPMPRSPHILLFGGGHVGLALARILEINEYAYTVVDDREDYAGPDRFPGAAECVVGRPAAFFAERDLSRYTHAVLLGYSYDLDLEALEFLLKGMDGYVGLIGSKAKATEFRRRLADRGLTEEQVTRLRCPIGVDIRSETAAEVATAIAAELVDTAYRPE